MSWPPLVERLRRTLCRWMPVRHLLSARSRVLLCNSYLTSILWHTCHFYTPPVTVVRECGRLVRKFIWPTVCWVSFAKLVKPLSAGGLGVDDILLRVAAFRMAHCVTLLQSVGSVLFNLVDENFCRSPGRVGVALMFRMSLSLFRPLHVGPFYLECLDLWRTKGVCTVFAVDPLLEPLFLSPHLLHPVSRRPLYDLGWLFAGVNSVSNLLDPTGAWRPFARLSGSLVSSSRNTALLRYIQYLLCHQYPALFDARGFRCPMPGSSSVSSFALCIAGEGLGVGYDSAKWWYGRFVAQLGPTPTVFPQVSRDDASFWTNCRPPLCRGREADVQWRLLHGALPTAQKLCLFGRRPLDLCIYCGVPGTLVHEYLDCGVLRVLLPCVLSFAASLCGTLHTPFEYFFLVSDVSRSASFVPVARHRVCRFLFVLLKSVMYRLRLHPSSSSVFRDRVVLHNSFFSAVLSRVNVEYVAACRRSSVSEFFQVWDPGGRWFLPEYAGLGWRVLPEAPPS